MTIEQQLNQLNKLVDTIEQDGANLDTSIGCYTEALQLAARLKQTLDAVDDKIQVLTRQGQELLPLDC